MSEYRKKGNILGRFGRQVTGQPMIFPFCSIVTYFQYSLIHDIIILLSLLSVVAPPLPPQEVEQVKFLARIYSFFNAAVFVCIYALNNPNLNFEFSELRLKPIWQNMFRFNPTLITFLLTV